MGRWLETCGPWRCCIFAFPGQLELQKQRENKPLTAITTALDAGKSQEKQSSKYFCVFADLLNHRISICTLNISARLALSLNIVFFEDVFF